MDEIRTVNVVQCTECDGWFEEDGPEGLVVHVLDAHPGSAVAKFIKTVIHKDA